MRTAVLASDQEPPRVAYAVSRDVGNAVIRNRVKRRLRAAVYANRAELEPGHGYLWRATPASATVSARELAESVHVILRANSNGAS